MEENLEVGMGWGRGVSTGVSAVARRSTGPVRQWDHVTENPRAKELITCDSVK
jgi:hypothetical protein